MSTVKRLAEEVEPGLHEVHPGLRKTVVRKLALAVGVMLEGQTPNTVELANLLTLDTTRKDMCEKCSQLDHVERLERLILIMALTMHWCVRVGRDDAVQRPTVLEKKRTRRLTPTIGASENSTAAPCLGLHEGCGI